MPATIQFGESFGALFIANMVTAILWGALCVQFYVYCLIYWKRDTWMLKTLIITVCLLDTAHQIFLSISIYEYLVTHWGDNNYVTLINWGVKAQSIPLYLSISFVQSFMVYRIYMFGRRIWLAIILETVVVAELAAFLSWGAQLLKDATYVELASVDNLSIACDAINAYNDIVIALVFAYIMQQQKSGFRRSTNMINKLIIYSLNTGLVTAAFGVGALVSTAVRRDTLIFAFFFFTGGRLYANSLLAIVNLRDHTRRQGDDSQIFTTLSRFQAAHHTSIGASNNENTASGGSGIPLENILSKDGSEGAMKGDINIPMAVDIKLDTEVSRSTDFQSSQNASGRYVVPTDGTCDSV
ncbi:hypothetical protein DENSPDRAFT_279945 [Dentipellis sp. KUC8613]|nr:hypothetical protein DENSPDRAFT_279945 [Dentipellis sp. KUC8613]